MHTLPPDFPIALAREVFARLCTSLPPPRDGTPEARAVRDDLAYAAVEAYYPVDAGEAELAVQIVAANAHALDSLRLAGLPGKSEEDIRRCRAQGNSMMRTAQSALRALERRQASREKAQNAMHPAAMERAGYWFKSVSVPEATPQPPPAEAAKPDGALVPRGGSVSDRRPAASGADPHPGTPASDAPMQAIVTGTSPIRRALSPAESNTSHRAGASRMQRYNETHAIRLSAGTTACR
jgi:hypothetical protein